MDPAPIGHRSKALTDLRRLSGRRRARSDTGRFVIDGPTLVAEAIDARAGGGPVEVEAVFAEPGAGVDVVDAARANGIEVVDVVDGAISKVTSPVTAQAVCARAVIPASATVAGLAGLVLVLDAVADPGNAGTLVRVAEAAGASAVLFCGDGVDPWNPKAVRASAGSVFRVPVGFDLDGASTVRDLGSQGIRVMVAAGDGAVHIDDADLTGNVAVVVGNEAHGVSAEVRAVADHGIAVPMAGRVESLNVAMAGAVIAFESARQRRLER